jgi:protein SCO1/2
MSHISTHLLRASVCASLLALASARAFAIAPLGAEFDGVDVKNKLGEKVDLNIPLIAPDGSSVTLAKFLDGERPVVFTLNFFRCASICSVQLNELVNSMKAMGWAPGEEPFRVVTVSFDPKDTIEVAAGKQETYRQELVRQLAEADDGTLSEAQVAERAKSIDWTFLVAREKAIRSLLDNVGYSVSYDADSNQFAHSPVTYVLSPEGKIARYLWGLQIPPQDLKFALMETSEGRLGSFGEKLLMSCFDYSRDTGGYVPFAWGFMRIGGTLVLVGLAIFLYRNWRREKKRTAAAHNLTHLNGSTGFDVAAGPRSESRS